MLVYFGDIPGVFDEWAFGLFELTLAVKLANRCFLVNGFGWNVGIVSGRMWKVMGKVRTGWSKLAWVLVYHVN